ncbi:FdtA/QdtA family cupin domain-containing protein [Flavobacterium sp. DG2-3]|uniref:sugar 3,4-ketoisomerase n=1 Tax=Flavobacterium sp. DG2-3 TaxID=3068317 RepID=UPI00273D6F0C|nr:FdtA/QdtA family cupin domain-containing protein [Flavobacterium sp. DG2-3]MDP5200119.1 FdtA/QdtA family cupin domain-containing protein [Flavobacterium sp. DG2-3]
MNDKAQIIPIPKIEERRGNLSVIENGTVPFDIKRVYYLYDVPAGAERGGHAHKKLRQFLVALSGSFDVVLKDGEKEQIITLNRPYEGLLINPGIWRELQNFSSGSLCLVIASEVYIEEDYIRNFDDFIKYATCK